MAFVRIAIGQCCLPGKLQAACIKPQRREAEHHQHHDTNNAQNVFQDSPLRP